MTVMLKSVNLASERPFEPGTLLVTSNVAAAVVESFDVKRSQVYGPAPSIC